MTSTRFNLNHNILVLEDYRDIHSLYRVAEENQSPPLCPARDSKPILGRSLKEPEVLLTKMTLSLSVCSLQPTHSCFALTWRRQRYKLQTFPLLWPPHRWHWRHYIRWKPSPWSVARASSVHQRPGERER